MWGRFGCTHCIWSNILMIILMVNFPFVSADLLAVRRSKDVRNDGWIKYNTGCEQVYTELIVLLP